MSHPGLSRGGAGVAEVSALARTRSAHGQVIDQPDALIYLPKGFQASGRYPVVAVFTPDGKINRSLGAWRAAADRNHWIVYVSKEYSNAAAASAPSYPDFLATIHSHLVASIGRLPADSGRIVLSGFSGGGHFALSMNEAYPGFAAAVVDNAGGTQYLDAPPGDDFPASSFAGSRRIGVFLGSPSDRRFFGEVKSSRGVYALNGWDTLFLTFPGGHVEAPAATYSRAASWIRAQPAWA